MSWRCLLGHRWWSHVALGHTDHTIHEVCERCAKSKMFSGQCTVWYDMDTGRRCGTLTEGRLADLASMAKIRQRAEQNDKEAHSKDWIDHLRPKP